MKALRWHNQKDLRLENIEEPQALEGKVKLKVEWCGICGSDLHEYTAGPIFIPTETHPLSGDKAPIVMGHEFSGQVVEVGEGVTTVQVGDRVTVEPIYACGECEACKKENIIFAIKWDFMVLLEAAVDFQNMQLYQLK